MLIRLTVVGCLLDALPYQICIKLGESQSVVQVLKYKGTLKAAWSRHSERVDSFDSVDASAFITPLDVHMRLNHLHDHFSLNYVFVLPKGNPN